MSDAPQSVSVQAQWILNPMDVPVVANQILLQPGAPTSNGQPDGVYVSVGHLNPPMAPGAEQVLTQEMLEGQILPVVPVARFSISRDRLVDFRDALDAYLKATENPAS